MGRCSPVIGGGGARGQSGVDRRCNLGERGDCLTCGETVTACGDAPSSLSSSSPIGVNGPPGSRSRGCGGKGMSDVGKAGVEAGSGVTWAFFFLPMPKKPRFSLVTGEEGAYLLSRREPAAKVVPWPFEVPFVCPLVTADVDGLVSSTSSSRSVESPSSSPALRGMPRTGAKPGGSS